MTVDTAIAPAAKSPGGVTIPVISEAVVEPVARTTRAVHGKIMGGVHWYIEQWEDLVAEAKAMLNSGQGYMSADDLLAHLAEAKVASDSPGRLRLRLKEMKGQDHLAEESAQALVSMEGVSRVEVSSTTGSILIYYDVAQYASREALLAAVAE